MVFRIRKFRSRSSRGQGLVEFALIVPVLMLMLLMALDFGRVFFGWVGLTNASRIGASYAAAHAPAWGSPGSATERASYEAQILADANALNCALPGTLPPPVFSGGTDLGDPTQVTLTCSFPLITPFVSQILGGSVTVRAESIFPVRAGVAGGIPTGSTVPTPAPTATPTPTPTREARRRPRRRHPSAGSRASSAPRPTAPRPSGSRPASRPRWRSPEPPNGNYTITNQSPGVGGQMVSCTTTIMTVYGT